MPATLIAFPREGFIIGDGHCRKPGPGHHDICLRGRDHDGDHQWCDWRGCRVRTPDGGATIRFGGFAH